VDEKGCIVSCDIFAELHKYVEYVKAVGLQRLKKIKIKQIQKINGKYWSRYVQ